MKKITIQQVKNGWTVFVGEEKPQTSAGNFEDMIASMAKKMVKEKDDMLQELMEPAENGVHVFKHFIEVVEFIESLKYN